MRSFTLRRGRNRMHSRAAWARGGWKVQAVLACRFLYNRVVGKLPHERSKTTPLPFASGLLGLTFWQRSSRAEQTDRIWLVDVTHSIVALPIMGETLDQLVSYGLQLEHPPRNRMTKDAPGLNRILSGIVDEIVSENQDTLGRIIIGMEEWLGEVTLKDKCMSGTRTRQNGGDQEPVPTKAATYTSPHKLRSSWRQSTKLHRRTFRTRNRKRSPYPIPPSCESPMKASVLILKSC